MGILKEERNRQTQPLKRHPVFANWDVVAKGWFIFCHSSELKKNQVKSKTICSQHLAVYRDDENQLYALDGYCPHMGVDMGIGKVVGKTCAAFFITGNSMEKVNVFISLHRKKFQSGQS